MTKHDLGGETGGEAADVDRTPDEDEERQQGEHVPDVDRTPDEDEERQQGEHVPETPGEAPAGPMVA